MSERANEIMIVTSRLARKPRVGFWKWFFTILEHGEGSFFGWGLPFVLNRIFNLVLGVPSAGLFAFVSWSIVDIIVPVNGVRFETVWKALWPRVGVHQYFAAIDRCALGFAWLDRADIILVVSIFIFGFGAGGQIRKSIIGMKSSAQGRIDLWAWALVMAICLSAVCVNYRPLSNPDDTIRCLQEFPLRSDL